MHNLSCICFERHSPELWGAHTGLSQRPCCAHLAISSCPSLTNLWSTEDSSSWCTRRGHGCSGSGWVWQLSVLGSPWISLGRSYSLSAVPPEILLPSLCCAVRHWAYRGVLDTAFDALYPFVLLVAHSDAVTCVAACPGKDTIFLSCAEVKLILSESA